MAEGEGKSIGWVIAALALVVLGGVWTFAAADYYQHEGGGPKTTIFGNAIAQIPNAPAVIGYTLKNRAWMFVVLLVLEAIVIGLGIVMKRVEKELNGPARGKKR